MFLKNTNKVYKGLKELVLFIKDKLKDWLRTLYVDLRCDYLIALGRECWNQGLKQRWWHPYQPHWNHWSWSGSPGSHGNRMMDGGTGACSGDVRGPAKGRDPVGAAICTVGTHHYVRCLTPLIYRIIDSIHNQKTQATRKYAPAKSTVLALLA